MWITLFDVAKGIVYDQIIASTSFFIVQNDANYY